MSAPFEPANAPDETPVIMPDNVAAESVLSDDEAEVSPSPENVIPMPQVERPAASDDQGESYADLPPLTPEQAELLRTPPMFWPPTIDEDPSGVQFGRWFGTGGARVRLWKDIEITLGGHFASLALLLMVLGPSLLIYVGAKAGMTPLAVLLTSSGAMLGIVVLVVVFLLLGRPRG